VTFAKSLDALVLRALEEDLASGDITTEATVKKGTVAICEAVAKSPLVLSGAEVFARCFYSVTPGCRVEQLVEDGTLVQAGTVLLRVEGDARGLLMAERTALNFLQRLSGTATLTRKFVDAAGDRMRICDTRKTTPGLRSLERRAVRDGGGSNHRDCLGSAVMIKDNHIAASGSITQAVLAARKYAPHTSRIEVEVTNLAEVNEALEVGADILLLDNFGDQETREAISRIKGRAIVELSGNMSLQRVQTLREIGADVISIGALTHSAEAADISLRLRPIEDGAPLVVWGV
jgi:nicotinate-nucleotide pyrophosphorylase (carboxylating)